MGREEGVVLCIIMGGERSKTTATKAALRRRRIIYEAMFSRNINIGGKREEGNKR